MKTLAVLTVLLGIGSFSQEGSAQELTFCFGQQCFPTLLEAENALRSAYPNYAEHIVRDGVSVVGSSGARTHKYRVEPIPGAEFYADYGAPKISGGTAGCTPSSPYLLKGCSSEANAAAALAQNSSYFYNCTLYSGFRPAGSYDARFASYSVSRSSTGKEFGAITYADIYGGVRVDLWPAGLRDFRGFEYEARCGVSSNPIATYRTSIERTITFGCKLGFAPRYIAPENYSNVGDIYSYPWCYATNTVGSITAVVRQVPSCPANGNPCHPTTGDKSRSELDFMFAGRPFHRYYHSLAEFDGGALSKGWTHSFAERIVQVAGGTPYWVTPDGYYNKAVGTDSSGYRFLSSTNYRMQLVGSEEVQYKITGQDGDVHYFDYQGNLTSLKNPADPSHDIVLEYSGDVLSKALSANGRTLEFAYHDDRLAEITGSGISIAYDYDTQGNLWRVRYGGGGEKIYHYNEAGLAPGDGFEYLLTGITSESGSRYATFSYDSYGRVISSKLHGPSGLVDKTVLAYTSPTIVEVQRDNGGTAIYERDTSVYRRLKSISAQNGTQQIMYDSAGYPKKLTDRRGLDMDLTFESGLLASTSASSRKTTFGRAPNGDVLLAKNYSLADGNEILLSATSYVYGADGTQSARCSADAGAITYTCGSQSDAPTGVRQWVYEYCSAQDVAEGLCPMKGLRLSMNGPQHDAVAADVIQYEYYSGDDLGCNVGGNCAFRKGDVWKTIDPLGNFTEALAYDDGGRPLSVKDPNGVITDYEYHIRGWLTYQKVRGPNGSTETDDRITTIEYWPTGLVKKVTDPDGAFTSYTYDTAHRLTDVSDNAGNTIHYTLDNAGNRIQEETKDVNGALKRTLSRVYNQLGQLQTQADAQSNPTDFTYDANGNLEMATDALGRVTDNDYDPLDRLQRTLQDVGGIAAEMRFDYDALDNLTKVTDPKGLETRYTYSGLGDLTQLESPDTGTTTYTYDSAGNRKTQTDARGVTTTYGYDALNRLTSIAYPDTSLDVAYAYDTPASACQAGETFAVRRLSLMTDGSGSTQYCYNRFGDLVRKEQTTNGQVFTLRYAYTKGGRLSALTYPDGAVVDYVRDTVGQVAEIGVTPAGGVRQLLLHQATYYPFGPAAGWTYGNGRSLSRTYDLDYRPQTILDDDTGGLDLGYGFDEVGNLDALTTAVGATPLLGFGYDALGRLTQTEDGPTATPIEIYTYDATGNRTSFQNSTGTQAYVYPATNHHLSIVGGSARTYDPSGNTTSIGGTAREFVYDDTGRMSQAKSGGAVVASYAYNGRGERVRKATGTSNTYTLYDETGRWLGDYDGSGAPIQQAVWLDDLPVGLLAGATQQLHYIQPDHLGTPRVVIDPVRDVAVWAWDAKSEAFGNSPPHEDPDTDGTVFVFDMRFPGQRYESATGLNYNYFRDYDPPSGRYIQSDPIGLAGGLATYSYAALSPLIYNDPTAENPAVGCFLGSWAGPVGCGAGALIASAVATGVLMATTGDSRQSEASSASRSVPWPERRRGKFTCICRANRDGRSPDNCAIDGQQFAFGYGEGRTLSEAKLNAEREAKARLGAKSTHHIQCRCRGPNGDKIIPHG